MKNTLFCSFILLACGVHAQTSTGKVTFPIIQASEGEFRILQKGTELKGKQLGQVLREQIKVETKKGRVRIQLSGSDFLIVAENSEFLIPAIDWDTGKVEEVELLTGSFGLDIKNPRQVRSSLFRDRITEGRYIFDMNPSVPQFGVSVLKGSVHFRGLETEEKNLLIASERQVFIGELEDGVVQYDTLLEGRKVARGRLGPKEKINPNFLAILNKAFDFSSKSALAAKNNANKGKGNQVTQAPIKDALCHKPSGKFNDCSYICENNPKAQKTCAVHLPGVQCVRRRCFAQGSWGDEMIYAKHLSVCEVRPIVRPCDY